MNRINSAISKCIRFSITTEYPTFPILSQIRNLVPPWYNLSSHFIHRTEFHSKSTTDPTCFRIIHREITSTFNDHIMYYTDASKSSTATSFAVVTKINDQFSLKSSGSLPPNTSVQTAEIYAIYQAVQLAHESNSKSIIFSDSKSSLQAIRNLQNTTYMCVKIRDFLLTSKNSIKLCWVPGHCGINGNEAADKYAKEIANYNNTNSIITPPSESFLYNWGRSKIQDARKLLWSEKDTFLQLHWKQIEPPKYHPSLSRYYSIILFRLRTGHTRLTHSHFYNREPAPQCRNCPSNPILSIKHILTECSLFKNFFNFQIPSLQEILDPEKTTNSSSLFEYLKVHNLLNKI